MTEQVPTQRVELYAVVAYPHAYVVLTDPEADSPGRYTVHRIGLLGIKHSVVVGKQLTHAEADDLIKRFENVPVARSTP